MLYYLAMTRNLMKNLAFPGQSMSLLLHINTVQCLSRMAEDDIARYIQFRCLSTDREGAEREWLVRAWVGVVLFISSVTVQSGTVATRTIDWQQPSLLYTAALHSHVGFSAPI